MNKYAQQSPPALNQQEIARRIVDDLLLDLTGRSGGDAYWYDIDRDTRAEFVATWRELVAQALAAYDPTSEVVYQSWLDEELSEQEDEDDE